MLRIIATYNVKGGVGKTTAAVNLAWLAARSGLRTVLWDLDPQGGATWCLGVEPGLPAGSRKLIRGKLALEDLIRPTPYPGLALLPADQSYRNMDLHLEAQEKPHKRLLRLMRPLAESFDLVLLDCAPSISLVSENVFRAADALLMPVVPNPLSLRAIAQVERFLASHRLDDIELIPFLSMVDLRKGMHRDFLESPPGGLARFSTAWIPYASDVERMTLRRAPLARYAPASRASVAYAQLWADISARLRLGGP